MQQIHFDKVSFRYGAAPLIFDQLTVNFAKKEADKGHVIGLMGASASGKSSLLNMIHGSLKPLTGSIHLNPQRPVISYLPQEVVLFDHLDALENARYFSHIRFYKSRFNESLFQALVQALHMEDVFRRSRNVSELSGGQRQRIGLLRALSISPDILLLDEPTNGLDADVKFQFLVELKRIISSLSLLTIYTSHLRQEMELIADEVAYCYRPASDSATAIFQDSIAGFINRPPVVEAARIVSFPAPNIIRCCNGNGNLVAGWQPGLPAFYLFVQPGNIGFSDTDGFGYTVLAQNSIHTFLQIGEQEQVAIPTAQMASAGRKIYFHGSVTRYSPQQLLDGAIQLEYGRILSS
ncbi:ABC transporter ATP-binding protein [Terrimonas sp. NA20]|uniref:ABC transporter ATP-binding protein n=1 Tax=Terrimonas ginsenosidimutans TaxID=2908004 RepID=A0ABS9KK53_9BACT|nr:ABC transporter ATP-binding protein [Terrimonas ginsenosidimutans]MCG2612699.1 ABC transporter ATP-binding protein [Terrimonas ginsenosidimutans]